MFNHFPHAHNIEIYCQHFAILNKYINTFSLFRILRFLKTIQTPSHKLLLAEYSPNLSPESSRVCLYRTHSLVLELYLVRCLLSQKIFSRVIFHFQILLATAVLILLCSLKPPPHLLKSASSTVQMSLVFIVWTRVGIQNSWLSG